MELDIVPQYEQRQVGALRVFSAARASRFTSGSGSRSGEESVRAESAYALSDSANARMTGARVGALVHPCDRQPLCGNWREDEPRSVRQRR